jgi:hypothetical protein
MELTRIIHPVGHGAFYTETIFNDKDNEYFNIVYDCGGSSKEIINKRINCYLDFLKQKQGCKIIHAVFISHLHTDHINGLDYLLDNADAVKFLFLPQLTKLQKIEMYMHNITITNQIDNISNNNKLIFNLNDDVYKGTKIIKILAEQDIKQDETKEISEEELNSHKKIPLNSGVKLYSNIFKDWFFIPYNPKILDDSKIKQLYEKIKNDFNNGIDFSFEDLPNIIKNYSYENNLKKIREIYNEIFDTDNHNIYSMPLFSGLQNATYLYSNKQCYECCKLRNCYKVLCNEFKNPNCLYTGDFMAKENRNLINLEKNYDGFWNTIETMQIPHHGSIYNHNSKLYSNIKNAFVNVDKKDNYKNTLDDICKNDCKKIDIVTENISTIKFYRYYKEK